MVGRAYGMIVDDATDSNTMRSSFFIDPDGIIRASCCYPPTVGRSVDEMLRVFAALQRVDADQIVTPAGWQPGDDVLLPPSSNLATVLAMPDDPTWFHREGRTGAQTMALLRPDASAAMLAKTFFSGLAGLAAEAVA